MAKVKQPEEIDARSDEIVEIQPARPVNVPQTNSLYRLVLTASDTTQSRQIAVVAAESEARPARWRHHTIRLGETGRMRRSSSVRSRRLQNLTSSAT